MKTGLGLAVVGLAAAGRFPDLAVWWQSLTSSPLGPAEPTARGEFDPRLAEALAAQALADAALGQGEVSGPKVARADDASGLVQALKELEGGLVELVVCVQAAAVGGAALVVQGLEDARRQGRRVYAVIRGFGAAGELGRAVSQALVKAGVEPAALSYLETGSSPPDEEEMAALKKIWGPRRQELPHLGLGHGPASGSDLIRLIKIALALHHRVLPASPAPASSLDLAATPFYLNTAARPWFRGTEELRRAGASLTEAGRHYHFVLEELPDRAGPGAAWSSELILISAADRAGLLKAMGQLQTRLAQNPTPPLDRLAYALARQEAGRERLAIVARDATDLTAKLDAAAEKLADPERKHLRTRSGISFHQLDAGSDPGLTVFLFPGQGSQKINLLADLCLYFPALRSWFEVWDEFLAGQSAWVPTRLLFPPPGELSQAAQKLVAAYLRSMEGGAQGAFLACLALFELLSGLGLEPAAMVGHSNGENAALIAAGVMRLDRKGVLAVMRRLSAKAEDPEPGLEPVRGVMTAVSLADREILKEVLAAWPGRIFWAMDNCPHQVVLFGDPKAMAAASEKLRRAGAVVMLLPFDRPFHTPLFAPQAEALGEIYRLIEVGPGRVPVYSCHTARPFPEKPEAIQNLAVGQWIGRVRFWETMEALYAAGFRNFIEVGPGDVLTAFVSDIFRGRDCLAMSCCAKDRPDLVQLQELVGQLFIRGLGVNPAALFEGRGLRPLRVEGDQASAPPGPRLSPRARRAVLKAHFGLMNEFLAAQERVLAKLGLALGSDRPAKPRPILGSAAEKEERWPLLGQVVAQDQTTLIARRRLDVKEDVFLLDHCLGRRFPGRAGELHPLAVLPFAFALEMLAQAAARLGRGRPVAAVENVRGRRWIALDQAFLDLELEARLEPKGGRVEVRMYDSPPPEPSERSLVFEGLVTLADDYPRPPATAALDPRPDRAPNWSAADFYRYCLFHGPRLQGVKRLRAHGPRGLEADLVEPAGLDFFSRPGKALWRTWPVVVDCAGQLVGYWLVEQCSKRFFGVFPYFLRSFRLFGPPPQPGAAIRCRAAMRFQPPDVESDFDFLDPAGRLVARLEGLRGRIFDFPEAFLNCLYWPEVSDHLSRPWLEESGLLIRRLDGLPKELLEGSYGIWKRALAHVTLGFKERELWRGLAEQGPRRTEWLLGRLAAKDVVRRWAAAELGLALEATEVEILPGDLGQPTVACAGLEAAGRRPSVSITHCGPMAAVALDPAGRRIGIDVESLAVRRIGRWLKSAFSEAELALLPDEDGLNLLALWCAKEAAAKASGRGLEGAPQEWTAAERSPDGGRVVVVHAGESWPVRIWRLGDEVAAVCQASAPCHE